jgi:hypothetical protein
MFNFKIWFSNNNSRINTVIIKIWEHTLAANIKYTIEEINMVQGRVCILAEMSAY